MSNTPAAPAQRAEASVRTWVKSQQQLHPKPGHFSAAFNNFIKGVDDFGTKIQPLMKCRQERLVAAA
jgi:hypothetical protein